MIEATRNSAYPALPNKTVESAKEFEAAFLGQVLREMGTGLDGDHGMGAGDDNPFGDLLQQEYARLLTERGGVGIADAVLKEMTRIQEGAL